jgi:hypothetical protein
VGWALGSGIEALASVIVVWRFTGSRMLSETAERRAQKAVAVSFWLLAPYIAFEAIRDLAAHHPATATPLGIALTAPSLDVGKCPRRASVRRPRRDLQWAGADQLLATVGRWFFVSWWACLPGCVRLVRAVPG